MSGRTALGQGLRKPVCAGIRVGICAALVAGLLGDSAALAQSTASDQTAPAPAAPQRPPIVTEAERLQWQAIGRVNVGGYRSRSLCTGTLISPDKVLTAAHCVVRKNGEVFAPGIVSFVAGWHKGQAVATARATQITIHPDYDTGPNPDRAQNFRVDIALLTLGTQITQMAPLPVISSQPPEGEIKLLGYRLDRPHALSKYEACKTIAVRPRNFGLSCDVAQGTSGAPVFVPHEDGWGLIGLIVARSKGPRIKSFATRIDSALLRLLEEMGE